MRVELVARTAGVGILEGKSLGEIMAYAARVSNPGNQHNHETSSKLLTYCLKQGHWSVFETASLTMEITTSRAIAAQILRHRSFTFQEFSQRYAEAVERECYDARSQDPKNRQNSVDDMDQATKDWFFSAQYETWEAAMSRYREALGKGIAKEQARFLLPLSTRTTLYMTGSVRSWIHYCGKRTEAGVQLEHKAIAEQCKYILLNEVPELREYFGYQEDYTLRG